RNECWIFQNMYGVSIEGSNDNEIYGNEMFDNSAESGIDVRYGAANNSIHDNNIYSTSGDYSQDTGITFYFAGIGNVVYQNDIHGHWSRGIYVRDSSPEIRKNSIYDNNIGIELYSMMAATASPSILNNLIYVKSGAMDDGIYIKASSGGTADPTIFHNTIDGGSGNGIYIYEDMSAVSASPDIKYNMITNFGIGISNALDYPRSPTIDYNDFWNNTGDYSVTTTAGPNDKYENPSYDADYKPQNPLAINRIPLGVSDSYPVTDDFEGNPRPQGDGRDMGCYENPVSIPQMIPIPPGIEVGDYRMISFTVVPPDPGCVTVFGDEMGGIYDEDNFRIGAYAPTISGYVDCGGGLVIEPGRAYWILARNGVDATVDGIPASISDTKVELFYNATSGDGWNQIACPNYANYSWDDVKVLEYDSEGCIVQGPTAISDLSDDNDMIDKRLWSWESGSYSDATTDMVHGNGYWVKAKKENVFLGFDQEVHIELAQLSNPGIMFASVWNKAKRWVKKCFAPETAIADSGDSPPMPMVALSGSSSGADSGGGSGTDSDGGGGGGCFIETVAMD
ncbi:MAG: right-handed parallel beta-helix repeat-containing protein, partial [Desulfobacteria bacterium]